MPHSILSKHRGAAVAARARRAAHRALALAFTAAALLIAPTAHAAELVLLGGEDQAITQLVIGEPLSLSVLDLTPKATYQARLTTGLNHLVAKASFTTDWRGDAGPIPLWRGAVTGCDPDAPPGFDTRANAEAALAGTQYFVSILDANHQVVELSALPLIAGTERTVTWTDASGCPRSKLSTTEDLWLEIEHAAPGEAFFFALVKLPSPGSLACDEEPLRAGQPLRDARSAGLQYGIADPNGRLSVPLWTAPAAGHYGLVLGTSPLQSTIQPGQDLPLTSPTPWKGGGTHGIHIEEPCLIDFCPDDSEDG